MSSNITASVSSGDVIQAQKNDLELTFMAPHRFGGPATEGRIARSLLYPANDD